MAQKTSFGYLQTKGIHFETVNKLQETKVENSAEVFKPNDAFAVAETDSDELDLNISPTSQLRKKILAKTKRTQTENINESRLLPIEEFRKYEAFQVASKRNEHS